MANNVITRGLDPEWKQGSNPEVAKYILKSTLALAMFKGSPYFIDAGYANACSTGADPIVPGTDGVTGSVVMMYGADGFPIHNIGTTPAGATIEGTIDPDQKFRIIKAASATDFTQADIGKGGNLTTETSTAGTATYGSLANYGSNYSGRQLSATLITFANAHDIEHGSQLLILERSPQIFDNAFTTEAAEGGIELWVKINPLANIANPA